MRSFSTLSGAAAVLTALALATLLGAQPSEEDAPPPKPLHGALSSVIANQRAALRPAGDVPPVKPNGASLLAGGYQSVGFDQLAGFEFKSPEMPSADVPAPVTPSDVMSQVPDAVKKLDDQKVVVIGFILPTKIEHGLATEFLLLNSPLLCCFGVTPATNAWIVVKMPKGIPPVQDTPLPIAGRLHVHDSWEGSWLSSVYQMDGDGLLKPHS